VTSDEEAARWIAAIMRTAGVDEVKIPDEMIVRMSRVSLLRYRDEMADVTVFRLTERLDVIDGEEVPVPAMAIEMGGAV
jgi:hypothetical protein